MRGYRFLKQFLVQSFYLQVVSDVVEKRRLVVEVESFASSWKNYDASTWRRRRRRRKSTNFQQKFVWFTYSNNAHRNFDCPLRISDKKWKCKWLSGATVWMITNYLSRPIFPRATGRPRRALSQVYVIPQILLEVHVHTTTQHGPA